MKKKLSISRLLIYIVLISLSVLLIFPFYWMLRSSFMTNREILTVPIIWIPQKFSFENYISAFVREPFARYFLNTIILVTLNVVGQVLSSSFIAFGFSRLKFKGRNFWFGVLLSTMMIPYATIMIPQFIGWQAIGAYNTFFPLFVPAFFGSAFNIFLVKQFYSGIPFAYDEAAYVDGANYLTIYAKIIMPMAKPALCSVAVFSFMSTWNDFLGPLLYLDKQELRTVSLGLQSFMGENTTEWAFLMATATVIALPLIVVYFFAQRYFVEGITFSGVKG